MYILREFDTKFMIICFIYLIKILFSAKAILEFLKHFYLNFNLEQYVRKKLRISSKNFVRFCRNLVLKLVQEHLKMLIISEVIQNLRKH